MRSIENLKEQIRDLLIKKNGDVNPDEYPDIIQSAKSLGLDKRQLSKLYREVDSTINWELIKKQKEEAGAREAANRPKELKKEIKEQKKKEQPQPTTIPQQKTPRRRSSSLAAAITAVVLLLLTISMAVYFLWLKDWLTDKNATRMYTYVSSLNLRSSPSARSEYNAIGNLTYGTEILVYNFTPGWVYGKVNGTTGFVSIQYLLNKKNFHELNAIFADNDTKEAIEEAKYRKALLNYFNARNIIGKMDISLQKEIYGAEQHKAVWQVFAKPPNNGFNYIAYPKVVNPNSKIYDFACLIKNESTGERKFLLFSFNDNEEATLEFEEDAPKEGHIRSVRRSKMNGAQYKVTYDP